MLFSVDLVSLVFYCVQELGVMLAVGAETIMLIAYLVALRDGVVDAKEAQFARAVRRALLIGLGCIVLSGVGATLLHMNLDELATIMQPAYLFKWLLILILLVAVLFTGKNSILAHPLREGFVAGTWYSLFIVHILAPVTSWEILFILYAVWLAGFVLFWSTIVHFAQGKKNVPAAAPKAAPVKQPVLPPKVLAAPLAPLPVLPKKIIEATPVPAPAPLPVVVKPVIAAMPPVAKIIPPAPHAPKKVEFPVVQSMPMPQKPFMPVPHKPAVKEIPIPHKPSVPAAAAVPAKSATPLENTSELSAIRVMPRTPDDILGKGRVAAV